MIFTFTFYFIIYKCRQKCLIYYFTISIVYKHLINLKLLSEKEKTIKLILEGQHKKKTAS